MAFNNLLNQRTSQDKSTPRAPHGIRREAPKLHTILWQTHGQKQNLRRNRKCNDTPDIHFTEFHRNGVPFSFESKWSTLLAQQWSKKKHRFNYQCLPLSSLFLIANLGKQVHHTSPPCITAGFRNQNGDPHHNRSPKTHVAFRDHGAPPKPPRIHRPTS